MFINQIFLTETLVTNILLLAKKAEIFAVLLLLPLYYTELN